MDSREIHHHHHQQQNHLNQQQLQPPPGMLMRHNSNSFNQNPNSAAAGLMGPTSTSQPLHHRLPFGSISPHQHHQQQQQQMDQKTLESLGFDGSPSSAAVANHQLSSSAMRFGIDQQAKKKRGRPRKYAPDGNIALGLAPTSPLRSGSNSYGGGIDGDSGGGGGGGGNANSSDPPAKRNRGRPPGSGKKQLDALGTGGVGFTPHVIEVKTGEDIALKVMAFTNQGPRAICILSATGAVSNAKLRQATSSSGVANYEDLYEIVSLSGSFLNTECNGTVTKSGNLSVSLAGPNGQVIGGSVAGMLIAGSQVQVVVGSFVPDGKKQKQTTGRTQQNNTPEPASAPANMLSFGGGPGSPRSQGQQHSSDSSEDNKSDSPLHRGNNNNNNNNHGLFGNSTTQPMHQIPMQMYHLWPGNNHQ
ncbi:unnamed protein product [Cochlearia groenlandica]